LGIEKVTRNTTKETKMNIQEARELYSEEYSRTLIITDHEIGLLINKHGVQGLNKEGSPSFLIPLLDDLEKRNLLEHLKRAEEPFDLDPYQISVEYQFIFNEPLEQGINPAEVLKKFNRKSLMGRIFTKQIFYLTLYDMQHPNDIFLKS
jgi:hypothetical protein